MVLVTFFFIPVCASSGTNLFEGTGSRSSCMPPFPPRPIPCSSIFIRSIIFPGILCALHVPRNVYDTLFLNRFSRDPERGFWFSVGIGPYLNNRVHSNYFIPLLLSASKWLFLIPRCFQGRSTLSSSDKVSYAGTATSIALATRWSKTLGSATGCVLCTPINFNSVGYCCSTEINKCSFLRVTKKTPAA